MESLSPVGTQFILHWGEMSSRWGINRTMAQIHALLYLSEQPLNAEEISRTLSVARSNVSNSLRELQAWGIVRVVHQMGNRRDYFETMKDAWEMFQVILEERKRREVDPIVAMLRECLQEAKGATAADRYPLRRMEELLRLLETLSAWYDQIGKLPPSVQRKVLKMGGKLRKLAG